MVDDYLAESAGNRVAFLSQVGMAAKAMAVVTATIASYLPIPIVSHLGDAALYALGEQSGAEFALAASMGVIPGGKLLKPFGKFLGNIGSSLWKNAKHYAAKGNSKLGGSILGITQRAKDWVERKVQRAVGKRGCGCFTATTLVLTPAGAVPIAEIEQGAVVLAAADDARVTDAQPGEVSSQIVIGEASLFILTVQHADGSLEAIHTTNEHPFHDAQTGKWVRADVLEPGDLLSALSGEAEVLSILFDQQRVPVYNLSIPTSPTYYVGQHGLWVHNRPECFDLLPNWLKKNFTNPGKIEYHWKKHAESLGKSVEQYMNDALDFYAKNKNKPGVLEITTEVGNGIKILGNPGGIFSKDGRIVSFWYDSAH